MNEEKELIEEFDEQSLSLMEDSPEASSEILYEDTSKRSENVKHFRMKNGSYVAAVYDKPVHIMDKSTGKFVDIAHRFEAKEDWYEAETNHFKARFPKKEGKQKYVTVEKSGRSVSWRYIPTTDSHKKRAEAAIHEHRRASIAELPQFPKLKYEKTEAQIDLEYGISEMGVKENIILTKRPKSNIFRFELKLAGLKAVLAEGTKSIQLYSDDAEGGDPEFVIPPINMTDGAGVYSEAAHYELTKDANSTVMEIVIDPEWLFAEARLYPVTIDPQVNIPGTRAAGNLTMVTVCSNGNDMKEGAYRRVGVDQNGNVSRMYVKIPLPELPTGYKITQAGLDLHQRGHDSSGKSSDYVVYPAAGSWTANSIDWDNQPGAQTNTVIDKFEGLNRRPNSPVKLDLTDIVNDWYAGDKACNGLVVMVPEAEASVAIPEAISEASTLSTPTTVAISNYSLARSVMQSTGNASTFSLARSTSCPQVTGTSCSGDSTGSGSCGSGSSGSGSSGSGSCGSGSCGSGSSGSGSSGSGSSGSGSSGSGSCGSGSTGSGSCGSGSSGSGSSGSGSSGSGSCGSGSSGSGSSGSGSSGSGSCGSGSSGSGSSGSGSCGSGSSGSGSCGSGSSGSGSCGSGSSGSGSCGSGSCGSGSCGSGTCGNCSSCTCNCTTCNGNCQKCSCVCQCKICSEYTDFYSNTAETAYKATAYIVYMSEDTYADHQKFETFDVGRAGTGSVNLFTGKMSFAHGDVSAEGVKLPLAVSHVYRATYLDDDDTGVYGKGWRLSVEQTVEYINRFGVTAVYTDAQGKRHYFIENEDGKITDDAGLGLYFKLGDCCDGSEAYRVYDEKGNLMRFNAAGKLYQMRDTNGNVSILTYTNGKLKKVTDGSRNTAEFTYTNNHLTAITDADDHTITYSYDAAGHLSTITYPSSADAPAYEGALTTIFTYDENNRLESITDLTGIKYTIEYNSSDKVSRITQSGTAIVTPNSVTIANSTDDAQSISFEYRSRSTAVKDDRTKIKTVYRFDENGRELSSYEDLSELSDTSLRSESTRTQIGSYNSILNTSNQSKTSGKYRALSANISGTSGTMKNLIRNGCFEGTANSLNPSDWSVAGSTSGQDGINDKTTYLSGKHSYRFIGGSTQTKRLTQTISLCDCQLDGNVLIASAWAKASGQAENTSPDATAKFQLYLKLSYENGEVAEYAESFDSGCTDWQYVAIPFVLDRSYKPVTVTYRLDYSNNTGTCYFTNARLVAVNGIVTTNRYRIDDGAIKKINVFGVEKKIRIISSKYDGVLTTEDYQDENSDTVRTTIIDQDGNSFTSYYQYDDKHNLLKTEDYRGTVSEYTYDADTGKQLTQRTYHKSAGNAYLYSSVTYNENALVASESDPRYYRDGEYLKTEYEYKDNSGLLTKRTETNDQVYNYTYDDKTDDLVSLSSAVDGSVPENRFFYTKGYLTKVEHNGFHFGFSYDAMGRNTAIRVGDDAKCVNLMSIEYDDSEATDKITTTYATKEVSVVETDLRGNPTKKTYKSANGTTKTISTAEYDEVGNPIELVDNVRGVCYNYTYDSDGNVVSVKETENGSSITNKTVYDKYKRVVSQSYGAVGHTYKPIYEKNDSGNVYPDGETVGITLTNRFTDQVERDGLGRTETRTLKTLSDNKTLFSESYNYLSTEDGRGVTVETQYVTGITRKVYGSTTQTSELNYTYDAAGNIETVRLGSNLISKYYYDGLNRLVREDNYSYEATYVWCYDVGGNITEKRIYALTSDVNLGTYESYKYKYATTGWRDQLASFNGEKCVYNALGNPTTYRNHALEWSYVRQLTKYDTNKFYYGADGIRYKKNNTVYSLNGSRILKETDGKNTLMYYYGGSGVIGFNYNGTDYYYQKNLQGDITAIYNTNGICVVTYTYDAWGKVLTIGGSAQSTIGAINPFRFRGYYYDVETGLYYLNSRYYDPETGRFISSDTTEVLDNAKDDIGGLNLYAYCDNNPVSGRDDDGNMSFWKKLAIAAAVVVAVAVVAAVVAAATAATGGAAGAALCAVTSTFVGAAKGAVIGAVTGAVSGAVTGAVTGAVEGYQEDGWDGVLSGMGKGALKGAVQGAQDGLLSGMVMGGIGGAMNPSFCFVAGTAVLTAAGHRAIEDVKIGDLIPCVDHITGERAEKRVVSTSVNQTDTLVDLVIGGEALRCTTTHPFQVKDKGWVDASKLQVGDLIYDKDWNTAPVEKVEIITLAEPVEVYNFEVEDCHTYYVGDNCWLVHNGCQDHHYLSNKNKRYTPKFKEITDKYGLDLSGDWNIESLENHLGRHTNKYHEFMLDNLKTIDNTASGNVDTFKKLFDGLKEQVRSNLGILYAK